MYKLLLAASFFLVPLISYAHPGNTDAYGCHACRTNCPKWGLSTGEYHCHASKGLTQPIEPVRSIKSDTGIGITIPAPEYRQPKISVPRVEEKKPVFESKPVVKPQIKEAVVTKPISTVTEPKEVEKPVLIKMEKKSWLQRLFGR